MRMSPDDHARVAAAIRAAEATTDGEIGVVVSRSSDTYQDVVLLWAFALALLPLAFSVAWPQPLIEAASWFSHWEEPSLRLVLSVLAAATAAAFLLGYWLCGLTAIRMRLVPEAIKEHRARRRAIMLFRAGTEQRTRSRTGVLLYLSLDEHEAEIVADAAIHAKAPHECWGEAMAVLIEGLRANRPGEAIAGAVERIGVVLAEHFPHTGSDPNELPDRMIEL
jgi:putative membrane protein